MKKLCIGILAHVDAGKTTLTESILFNTGMIRSAGRVDNGDAFLDTEALEKKRGVTILSKQAIVRLDSDAALNKSEDDVQITIIDTPGHMDFIGETERALSVLDVAILLISGPDGVTASTKRLIGMLESYRVPFYIFVNKMDMCQRSEEEVIEELRSEINSGCISFTDMTDSAKEEIASLSEDTIEKYLEGGDISRDDETQLLFSGKLHPVLFGSALKNTGVDQLIETVTYLLKDMVYRDTFSGKVFKLGFEDGHKLTFLKITGGEISVRNVIDDSRLSGEKINQIRSYSGGKYEAVETAEAGDVVTLLGLENTYIGMGLGEEYDEGEILCQPVLRYDMILPKDVPSKTFIPKLKELMMENPLLGLDISDGDRITISVMGEFELEILKETIKERYGAHVSFTSGSFVYKETINSPVIGYGHFEPLRHYAEAHILMEPLPRGTGIQIASDLRVSELDINWQKTILSTISEHLPVGVLTGSALTDIRFTLIAGKAHLKHTDSQDFREAVCRAIRQGLMKTDNQLLEPEYDFTITLPVESVGRAMNDISGMGGKCSLVSEGVLTGKAPARCIANYQSQITEYTSGQGSIDLRFTGFTDMPEDVALEVVNETGYDPDNDSSYLSGSVFISHGAGYYVPWYECEQLMHVPSRESDYFDIDNESEEDRIYREAERVKKASESHKNESIEERFEAIGTDEIDAILRNATHANSDGKDDIAGAHRHTKRVYLSKSTVRAENRARNTKKSGNVIKTVTKKKYLLVDGYNIIHAWKDLKGLLSDDESQKDKMSLDLEAARYKLLDIMSEYRVMKGTEIIVVFDAYNVRGHFTETMDYMGVHVVYTKEAETADQYISRFTIENSKNLDITVSTSDGMIQLIIRGENSKLMSARELEMDVRERRESLMNSNNSGENL